VLNVSLTLERNAMTATSIAPFIYLSDLEEHAEGFRLSYGWDETNGWSFEQVRDYMLAHGYNPDHQANVIAGLATTEHTICRDEGHDWIEEGEGGPDSGWIGATCARCGYSHSVTLY